MKYSWIANVKTKNHAVTFDISNSSNRETVIVDGKIIIDENSTSPYHSHRFAIDGEKCQIKLFALNNYVIFFVKLYVNKKLIPKYKKNDPLPNDVEPTFLSVGAPELFKPTPPWYWLFIIANICTIHFMKAGYIWTGAPTFIATLAVVKICRSNPGNWNIKQRLLACIGITILNFASGFLIYYFA